MWVFQRMLWFLAVFAHLSSSLSWMLTDQKYVGPRSLLRQVFFSFFFFLEGGGGWEESRVVYFVGVGVLAQKKRVSRFQMSRGWHLCKTDSVRDRLETDFLESSSGGVFVRVSFPSFTVQALRIQQGSTSPQRWIHLWWSGWLLNQSESTVVGNRNKQV